MYYRNLVNLQLCLSNFLFGFYSVTHEIFLPGLPWSQIQGPPLSSSTCRPAISLTTRIDQELKELCGSVPSIKTIMKNILEHHIWSSEVKEGKRWHQPYQTGQAGSTVFQRGPLARPRQNQPSRFVTWPSRFSCCTWPAGSSRLTKPAQPTQPSRFSCYVRSLSKSVFDIFSRRKQGGYDLDLFSTGIRLPPLYISKEQSIEGPNTQSSFLHLLPFFYPIFPASHYPLHLSRDSATLDNLSHVSPRRVLPGGVPEFLLRRTSSKSS